MFMVKTILTTLRDAHNATDHLALHNFWFGRYKKQLVGLRISESDACLRTEAVVNHSRGRYLRHHSVIGGQSSMDASRRPW